MPILTTLRGWMLLASHQCCQQVAFVWCSRQWVEAAAPPPLGISLPSEASRSSSLPSPLHSRDRCNRWVASTQDSPVYSLSWPVLCIVFAQWKNSALLDSCDSNLTPSYSCLFNFNFNLILLLWCNFIRNTKSLCCRRSLLRIFTFLTDSGDADKWEPQRRAAGFPGVIWGRTRGSGGGQWGRWSADSAASISTPRVTTQSEGSTGLPHLEGHPGLTGHPAAERYVLRHKPHYQRLVSGLAFVFVFMFGHWMYPEAGNTNNEIRKPWYNVPYCLRPCI